MSKRSRLVLAVLLTGVHGCASETGETELGVEVAPLSASCRDTSEFRYESDPAAEAAARTRLSTIMPKAVLSWSSTRGTLAQLSSSTLEVTGCQAPDADLHQEVLSALKAEPEIFQLDVSEWSGSSAPCSAAADGTILSFYREHMAGRDARGDSLSVILDVSEDGKLVRIERVFGHYLPAEIPGLEEFSKSCPTLTPEQATDIAYASSHPYVTFDLCMYTGEGKYTPELPDAVTAGETSLEWNEQDGKLTILARSHGTLTVDPSHHTQELLQSNAHCPWGTVAWNLRFDPVKRALVESWPGVDCVVC